MTAQAENHGCTQLCAEGMLWAGSYQGAAGVWPCLGTSAAAGRHGTDRHTAQTAQIRAETRCLHLECEQGAACCDAQHQHDPTAASS